MTENVVLGSIARQSPALTLKAANDLGAISLDHSHRSTAFCAHIGA